MLFLELTEYIQIVSVSSNPQEHKAHIIYSDDLRKHLSHHDIHADAITVDELAEGTEKTILQSAFDFDADLIVMGAYGQTRLKEVILGGTSRYLLKDSITPLLLSH
jgi:nucleotide-binding universal stress UspA family protein